MNDAKLISKLNEMMVVQAASLNAYQYFGEKVSNDENIVGKFITFTNDSKEMLAVLNSVVDSLGGEVINNVEDLAQELRSRFDSVITDGSFSPSEILRAISALYLLETLNSLNWKIVGDFAEEEEDERLLRFKESKEKVIKMTDWLKDQIVQRSINNLK